MPPDPAATVPPRPPADPFAGSVGDLATATGDPPAPADDRTATRDAPPPAGTIRPDPPPGFAIETELGVGGMGAVYLARQVGLNRPVALKLVRAGETADPKALIRFLAEAEAVAAVRHPNVVEVYAYGDHQGKPYMALEYCGGGDLTALTATTPTRDAAWFRRAADLMAGVAAGVQAAHAAGIVHRDLKPGNVLLTADGVPKVADFGLAKRGAGSDLTKTHAVMGTPAYMSPEQAGGGGKFVGPEADVWALGVMLYELACGGRPFDGGNVMEVLAAVAAATVPPLKSKCPAVPPDLALITHKCLSKDPRDRYPTAGAPAADLRNWLDGKPITARPAGVVEQAVKWARRNKKLAGMGLAVLLTMAAATAVSVGFGLEANTQADIARTRQKDAEDERAKADAATARAEEEVGRTQLALARALLAPLSNAANTGPSEYERNALWELAAARRDRLPLLVYAEATRTRLAAAQFSARGRHLDHAAVGLDPARRREADALLAARLADPALPADHRRSLAFGAADVDWHPEAEGLAEPVLEVLRGELATEHYQVAKEQFVRAARRLPRERELDVLLAALAQSPSSYVSVTLTDALLRAAADLPPDRANAVRRDTATRLAAAMKEGVVGSEEYYLAQALAAAVERLPAGEAADRLLAALRTSAGLSVRQVLVDSLRAVVRRLPAGRAADVRAAWSAELAAGMTKDLEPHEFSYLAEWIAAAEAGPLPTPAHSRCERAAAVLLDALDARPAGFQPSLASALAALAPRLPNDRAASVCGTAAGRLLDRLKAAKDDDTRGTIASALPAIAKHVPADEWAGRLSAATDRATGPYERRHLAEALAVVADRLPADRAAAACGAAAEGFVTALRNDNLPTARTPQVEAVAALAERMTPDDGARVLLDAMDRDAGTTDRVALARSLLAVVKRLPADRRAGVSRRAVTGLLSITQGREFDEVLVARLVAGHAGELPAADRAKVLVDAMAAAGQKVYGEAIRDYARAVCEAAGHLPPDAGAEVLVAAVPKAVNWSARGDLVRGVLQLTAAMPADRAASWCGKAADQVAVGFERGGRATDHAPPAVFAARLAPRLTPAKRAAVLATALKALGDGLAAAEHDYDFRDLGTGLAAVAARLPDAEGETTFHRAAVAFLTARAMGDTFYRSEAVAPFAAALVRLTEDEYERRRKAAELAALAGGVALHPDAVPTPRPLPPQTLVEFLKHPLCVREARRAVLDALEVTYDRQFKGLWEFVAFAEKEHPELDLLTPPERPEPVDRPPAGGPGW